MNNEYGNYDQSKKISSCRYKNHLTPLISEQISRADRRRSTMNTQHNSGSLNYHNKCIQKKDSKPDVSVLAKTDLVSITSNFYASVPSMSCHKCSELIKENVFVLLCGHSIPVSKRKRLVNKSSNNHNLGRPRVDSKIDRTHLQKLQESD